MRAQNWVLWCRDLFDRDTPPSRDGSGEGILSGLEVLWSRTLGEGVDDRGRRTFQAFHLAWNGRRAEVAIAPTGGNDALAKLKRWRSPELVQVLAHAHHELLEQDDACAILLAAADDAADCAELIRRLTAN